MVVKMKDTLLTIQEHLRGTQRLPSVGIGEPMDPPEDMHAAVFLGPYSNPATTLNGSIELRSVIVRIYLNALEEPREEIEFKMDEAASELHSDLLGDFELGGDVRNIEPTLMTVTFGYQSIGGVMFRIVDILIPMTVDDNATMAK